MSDSRRTSRADRRKHSLPFPGPERRGAREATVQIISQVQGNELQIFVRDPITAENTPSTRESLLRHAQRSRTGIVIVDLEKSTYLDTPGMAMLFDVKKQINSQGRAFYLQNPSRCVQRMLNLTRMVRLFPVRFTTQSDVQAIPTVGAAPSSVPTSPDTPIPTISTENIDAKSA